MKNKILGKVLISASICLCYLSTSEYSVNLSSTYSNDVEDFCSKNQVSFCLVQSMYNYDSSVDLSVLANKLLESSKIYDGDIYSAITYCNPKLSKDDAEVICKESSNMEKDYYKETIYD